jgi:hypothetical protein
LFNSIYRKGKIKMDTTSLVPELIIIGLQSFVWIFFLLIITAKVNWSDLIALGNSGGAISLIVVVLIAFAYVLGIIVDYVSSLFIIYREKNQKIPLYERTSYIRVKNPDAYSDIDKLYNRIKLLRASIFNIILLGMPLLYYCLLSNLKDYTIIIFLFYFLFLFSTYISWSGSYKSYLHHVNSTYKTLIDNNNSKEKKDIKYKPEGKRKIDVTNISST